MLETTEDLRAFYVRENRKREARDSAMLIFAWLAAGSGAVWLCKIALHWQW